MCMAEVTEKGFGALRKMCGQRAGAGGTGLSAGGRCKFPLGDIGQGAALIRFEAADTPLEEKIAAAKGLFGDGDEIGARASITSPPSAEARFNISDLDVWRLYLPPSEAAAGGGCAERPLWLGDLAGAFYGSAAKAEDGCAHPRDRGEAGGHAMLLRAPAESRAGTGPISAPASGPGRGDGRGQGGLRSAGPFQSRTSLETGKGNWRAGNWRI